MSRPDLAALDNEVVQTYLSFPSRDGFLPVSLNDGILEVWVRSSQAEQQAAFLAWELGVQPHVRQVSETDFMDMLEYALGLWESEQGDYQEEEEQDQEQSEQNLVGWSHEDAPIVRLVNKILHQAVTSGASDVHFESTDKKFVVRFRLDGELRNVRDFDRSLQPTVLARIKVMAEMDVAESRKPQDGRIQVRAGSRTVDIRVSTVPTIRGEKAVLRLLDQSRGLLSLEKVGFDSEQLKAFRRGINSPYGIILVTGPTGSGKTTTLYGALKEIQDESSNIMTVEDPVEYQLAGVNQVQVNQAAGVTFAKSVRSFLRQDPDVILVGEIRDRETADTAIQASLTGHLVLSTLHTNDAPSAITRLLEMGLQSFLVASSLSLVMAQRLVRLSCPHCSRTVPVEFSLQDEFPDIKSFPQSELRGSGCAKCLQTGYSGRTGIFELMEVESGLRKLIGREASSEEMADYSASKGGYTRMIDQGLELVRAGRTTLEEILRVTKV